MKAKKTSLPKVAREPTKRRSRWLLWGGLGIAVASFLLWEMTGSRAADRRPRSPDVARPKPLQEASAGGEAVGSGEAPDPRLVVQVLDPARRPVAGAHVEVGWTVHDRSAAYTSAVTEASGLCSLRLRRECRKVSVHGRAPGYPAQNLGSHPAFRTFLSVTLYPSRAVSGRVIGDEGTGVVQAQVTLHVDSASRPTAFTTGSGEGGRYRITGIEPDAEGGVVSARAVAPDGRVGFVRRVLIAPHDESTIDIVVQTSFVVQGLVVDERGSPVAGAEVRLEHKTRGRPGQEPFLNAVMTDSLGNFEIEGIPLGILKPGSTHLAIRKQGVGAGFFDVPTPNESASAKGRFVLRASGSIRGHLLEGDGVPLAQLTLRAQLLQVAYEDLKSDRVSRITSSAGSSLDWFVATTNERGEFLFPSLPTFKAKPAQSVYEIRWAGALDWILGPPRDLPPFPSVLVRTPPGEETRVEIRLPKPTARVLVALTDPHGSGLPGASVYVKQGNNLREALTNSQGECVIDLYQDQAVDWVKAISLEYGEVQSGPVNVTPAHVHRVELRFPEESAVIAGFVLDESGRPVTGARVYLDDGAHVSDCDETSGFFKLRASAGIHRLTARGASQKLSEAVVVGVSGGQRVTIILSAGAHARGKITGRVVGIESSGDVWLTRPLDGKQWMTRLSHSARFRFEGLPPGEYLVRVAIPSVITAPKRLTLARDGTRRVEIEVFPGSRIQGRLVTPAGARVFPCAAFLWSTDARAPVGLAGVGSATLGVQADGTVIAPRLRIGRGRFRLRLIGNHQWVYPPSRVLMCDGARDLDVSATLVERADLTVKLRWGRPTVRPTYLVVLDAGGLPVQTARITASGDIRVEGLAPGTYSLRIGDVERTIRLAAAANLVEFVHE